MKPNDFDLFAEMLTSLADLYGKELTEASITLWWRALAQYDVAAVREGFDRHVRNVDTGQFMPKPADVLKMLHGTTQDSAMLGWAKVDRAVRQVGIYRSVVFDDALVHRVLHDMGGWAMLGTKKESEWPFVAKEFENRYRGYCARNDRPEYPPVMIGTAQAHNAAEGFELEPPVLVGDPQSARVVMLGGTTAPLITFTPASELQQLAAPQQTPRRLAA